MDANQVKAFCDAAAALLPQLSAYAAQDVPQHSAADDALVRQLRVSAGAIADAINTVARMTPPPMPQMPPPFTPPGAPTAGPPRS